MTKATGLIFRSLFDVALAQEVPFGTPQYAQCILTSTFLCVPFMLAAKLVNLVVACNGFEIVHIFHSSYFELLNNC